MPNFIIRDFIDTDKYVIQSTWLNGLKFSSYWFRSIPNEVFFEQFKDYYYQIIKKSKTKVICLPDAPEVLLGYAVYTDNILHWVYVKLAFRKLGLAKALVPENISICTNLTKIGKSIADKKGITFNPFIEGEKHESNTSSFAIGSNNTRV